MTDINDQDREFGLAGHPDGDLAGLAKTMQEELAEARTVDQDADGAPGEMTPPPHEWPRTKAEIDQDAADEVP